MGVVDAAASMAKRRGSDAGLGRGKRAAGEEEQHSRLGSVVGGERRRATMAWGGRLGSWQWMALLIEAWFWVSKAGGERWELMIYHYWSINGKERNRIPPVSCLTVVSVVAGNRVKFQKICELWSPFQGVIWWKQPPGVRRGGRGEPNATGLIAGGGRRRKISSGRVSGFRGGSGLISKFFGISLIFLENSNFVDPNSTPTSVEHNFFIWSPILTCRLSTDSYQGATQISCIKFLEKLNG